FTLRRLNRRATTGNAPPLGGIRAAESVYLDHRPSTYTADLQHGPVPRLVAPFLPFPRTAGRVGMPLTRVVSAMGFAHSLRSVARVLRSRCRRSRDHRGSNRAAHRTCP